MPLAIDPNETFDVVLESDQDKPKAQQTRFHFRYMTAREYIATAAIGDIPREEQESLGTAEVVNRLFEAIHVNYVGVSGPRIPADSHLEDVVTISEAWELYYSARRQSKLSVPEKNDSESPSHTSGDDSVKDAPAPESATIPSAPAAPASSNAPDAEKPDATTATAETSD